ncbi:kinase-like protein [Calocera cornea HHB12733]|uniref:Kinase-like protein n=1 Tax=Calocera cornea HHB12733 TaxID=1353952 RepID=A0A165EI63_9BASI|nr:kinase-like protein [Calocera cornea HHB12733]
MAVESASPLVVPTGSTTRQVQLTVDVLRVVGDLTPWISNVVMEVSPSGIVWTAKCGSEKVVLKVMRIGTSSSGTKAKLLGRDLPIWMRLSHPNILELYGVCSQGPYGFAMVHPFFEHGTARDYLMTNPSARRLPLVLDVARGLDYLHSRHPPVVHGDLVTSNVLIRDDGQACLTGFGMARTLLEIPADEASESLPPASIARWLAPEVIYPGDYGLTVLGSLTTEADVYAFGMVAYELCTDRKPFHEFLDNYKIANKVATGERPSRPADSAEHTISDSVWGLLQECWRQDWRERLSTAELVRRVADLVQSDS